MPRSEPMDLDDDDQPGMLARVPVWAWVAGGLGVAGFLTILAVKVTILFLMPAPVKPAESRPADAREIAATARDLPGKGQPPKVKAPPKAPPVTDLSTVQMDTIADAYQLDRDAAEAKYNGKRLRVEITVRMSADGWVGTVAQLTRPEMRKIAAAQAARERQEPALRGWVPNVVFHVAAGNVDDHKRAVVEGTCAGLTPDLSTGLKLTFTDARFIPWPLS